MNDNDAIPMVFALTAPVDFAETLNPHPARQGVGLSALPGGGAYLTMRHLDGTLLAATLDDATLDRFARLLATTIANADRAARP